MKRQQGRPSKYPWKSWLARKRKFVLTTKDYSCSQKSMGVMIRTQARLNFVKVSLSLKSDGSIHVVLRRNSKDENT
jgi:hypothetical protein